MNYYLYQTSMTGVVEWRYAEEKETGNLPEQATIFMTGLVTPHFPLTIYSRQLGTVSSSFDAEITLVPGVKRYGMNEQGDSVLCLEWQESYYNLFVAGYPPFVVQGVEYSGRSYWITADGHKIASIEEIQKQAAGNGDFELDNTMMLQVDDQYTPLVEIFATIPALVFFPLTEKGDTLKSCAPREAGIKFTPLTKKALKLSFEAHKDQVDKSGLPYVFHPFHLAEQMETEDATVVALLHDVVEDTDYTLEDLRSMGYPPQVIEALALLTHDKAVPYLEYVRAIKDNPLARRVKLADLRHNSDLSRLDTVDEKAMERVKKYAQAIQILEGVNMETKGLYQRCYALSEYKSIIDLSHLPFEDGYYVTENDVVLKVENRSIYRLDGAIWVQAQHLFSLWHDSMTNFADIPQSIVKELGLENIVCPASR